MNADEGRCPCESSSSAENLVDLCFERGLYAEHRASPQSLAILGDSLEILSKMRLRSVDLIFADPPYNIGKDFGNNIDRWPDVQSYVGWCKTWIDECMRVLKDDGTLYFMTATPHMPYLDVFVSEKYHVLSRIVLAYDSSGVQSKSRSDRSTNRCSWSPSRRNPASSSKRRTSWSRPRPGRSAS